MIRLMRAAKRTLRRLARPLRLRWIDIQHAESVRDVEHLYGVRDDVHRLISSEQVKQVRLEMRRNEIERGAA